MKKMGNVLNRYAVLIMALLLFAANGYAEKEPKALFDLGVKEFKAGRFEEAATLFSELIAISPDDAKAYKNRGVALMNLGRIDSAIADFDKAVRIDPELKGLYSNLGAAWHYKGAYDKAIAAYDMDIAQRPELYITYFNRALSRAELNQLEMALVDIEKSLELKPDFEAAASARKDLQEKLSKNAAKGYVVQAGAFLVEKNAVERKAALAAKGYEARVVMLPDSKQRIWYVVRFGEDLDHDTAEKICGKLKEQENIDAVIRPAGKL